MPPLKGTYASKVLSFQQDHPLKTNGGAVGAVYELPKKRIVPSDDPLDASKVFPLLMLM